MLLRFYLQLNFMKKHTKLLRSNLLQSLYRAYLCNFSFTDYTHVRHRKNGKSDNLWNLYNKYVKPEFTDEPYHFAEIFDFIFLASIDRSCD